MAKTDYTSDIVSFYQDLYPLDTGRAIIPPWLAGLLYSFFPLPEGNPAARNVLWSTSKKQGKSTTAGCVALYMASRRRYAEVVIAAADKDQAKDRVFRSVRYAVENHPVWRGAKVYRDIVELDNGSLIQAIAQDWRGAAGGNYSAVIFDELHTYTQEYQRRLYDELVIPPTQPEGVRWVASYAGWLGESHLLREIWEKALTGSRTDADLPVYSLPEASLMAFIDTGEASWRMPWTTPAYMREIRESERPNTYRRLWLNEWVSQESEFITPEAWQACYSPDCKPLLPKDRRRAVFGADASTSRDLTALVGVTYNQEGGFTDVVYTRTWKPKPNILRLGKPTIDLDETIKAEILHLHAAGLVEAVVYDPYQLHSIAMDLSKAGVRMIELPQTAQRVEADQALYDAIIGRLIRHYGDPTLNEHINNAVAIETPRGFRLAKEKTSRKIDAAVALSMAHHGALNTQKAYGQVIIYPDFFDDPLLEDETLLILGNRAYRVNINTPERHREGITWETCKLRNKGCRACMRELYEAGEYARQAEEAALYANAGKPEPPGFTPYDAYMAEMAAKRSQFETEFWRAARRENER